MIDKIFEGLAPVEECFFKYYELSKYFDVSINFIKEKFYIPPHVHKQDIFNYVFEGEFVIVIGGKQKIYKKGDWVNIPKNIEHSVKTEIKTILLELWRK